MIFDRLKGKGKKKQGKVMSLSEFHASTEGSSGNQASGSQTSSNVVRMNWADEMEKLDDSGKEKYYLY